MCCCFLHDRLTACHRYILYALTTLNLSKAFAAFFSLFHLHIVWRSPDACQDRKAPDAQPPIGSVSTRLTTFRRDRHTHKRFPRFFFLPMPDFVTKVGPEGISADTIPCWMVQLLVLGQPAGYVCIPNRNLEESAVSPAGSATRVGIKQATEVGEGEPGASEEAASDEEDELRTLGDLRDLISWQLNLAIRGVELWIAPPEICSSGTFPSTRGDGNVEGDTDSEIFLPKTPRGDKALLDNMDLGHYGLHHLSVVDVRLSPEYLETGCGGSEATQAEGGISGEVSEKDEESSKKQGEK